MKTLNKYIAGVSVVGLLLTAVSCSKDFYTNKNNNPNAPSNLLPNVLLSPIEVSLGYAQGGDMSRFASMFVQQTVGVSRQSAAYYQYIFTNQDPESLWDNMYAADMENDYNLMQICANSGGKYNAYKGITEALQAYNLQVMVDCWGNMPYSQAFQGASNLKPTYDKDATLYSNAVTLCYNAIADLNNSANDVLSPGSDDLIYGGSTASWIAFSHAVLARLYIHQSQTGSGNVAMADSALAHANAAITAGFTNAQVNFGVGATNNAPNYQFWTQRGDISYTFADGSYSSDGFFFGLLATTNDPRKFYLIDSADEINFNYLNAYYQEANSPVDLICADEVDFIAAEAVLRAGGSIATAQTAYQAGITADMNRLSSNPAVYTSNPNGITGPITGAQITAYLAAHGNLSPVLDSALAQVANQEYIALYMNPEAWTCWRRSTKIPGFANGSPALLPVPGPFASNGIPRRFLYPQSELNLNGANTPNATQWSPRNFWDN